MRLFRVVALFFVLTGAAFGEPLGATVQRVDYDPESRTVRVAVESSTEPAYSDFELADPPRVVLDLADSTFPANKFEAAVGDGLVARLRAAQFSVDPNVTRIVVDLEAGVSGYTVGVVGSAPSWTVRLTAVPAGEVAAVEPEARLVEEAALEPQVVGAAAPPIGSRVSHRAETRQKGRIGRIYAQRTHAQLVPGGKRRMTRQARSGDADAAHSVQRPLYVSASWRERIAAAPS